MSAMNGHQAFSHELLCPFEKYKLWICIFRTFKRFL